MNRPPKEAHGGGKEAPCQGGAMGEGASGPLDSSTCVMPRVIICTYLSARPGSSRSATVSRNKRPTSRSGLMPRCGEHLPFLITHAKSCFGQGKVKLENIRERGRKRQNTYRSNDNRAVLKEVQRRATPRKIVVLKVPRRRKSRRKWPKS